jgi:hypothetical protein
MPGGGLAHALSTIATTRSACVVLRGMRRVNMVGGHRCHPVHGQLVCSQGHGPKMPSTAWTIDVIMGEGMRRVATWHAPAVVDGHGTRVDAAAFLAHHRHNSIAAFMGRASANLPDVALGIARCRCYSIRSIPVVTHAQNLETLFRTFCTENQSGIIPRYLHMRYFSTFCMSNGSHCNGNSGSGFRCLQRLLS